jgi:hypothetical protein
LEIRKRREALKRTEPTLGFFAASPLHDCLDCRTDGRRLTPSSAPAVSPSLTPNCLHHPIRIFSAVRRVSIVHQRITRALFGSSAQSPAEGKKENGPIDRYGTERKPRQGH